METTIKIQNKGFDNCTSKFVLETINNGRFYFAQTNEGEPAIAFEKETGLKKLIAFIPNEMTRHVEHFHFEQYSECYHVTPDQENVERPYFFEQLTPSARISVQNLLEKLCDLLEETWNNDEIVQIEVIKK